MYGVLTVLIGHSAEVTERLSLPPGAFRPPPKSTRRSCGSGSTLPTPAREGPALFSRARRERFHAPAEDAGQRALGLPGRSGSRRPRPSPLRA